MMIKAFTLHPKSFIENSKPQLFCNVHLKPLTHMCIAKDCPNKLFCESCKEDSHYMMHKNFIYPINEYVNSIPSPLMSTSLASASSLLGFSSTALSSSIDNLNKIETFLNTKNDIYKEINDILDNKENDILALFDDLKRDINEILDIAYQNYCNQLREKHNTRTHVIKNKLHKINRLFNLQKSIIEKNIPKFETKDQLTDFVNDIGNYHNKMDQVENTLQQKYNKLKVYLNNKDNFALEFDQTTFMKYYVNIVDFVKRQFNIKGSYNSDSYTNNHNESSIAISSYLEESKTRDSYTGHEGDICSLVILNSDMAATAGHDSLIKLWDLKSGECTGELHGHKDAIWSIKTCYNGKYLISSSSDKTIKLWKIQERKCKKTFKAHTKPVYCTEFMSNMKFMASGSQDSTIILWDMNEGRVWKTLVGHYKAIWDLKHINEKQLISCSEDCSIKIWDIKSATCLQTMVGHSDTIYGLCLLADNTTLISCSDDKTLKIWDLKIGICTKTIHGHDKGIRSIAVNKSETLIASGGYDHVLKIWDLENYLLLKVHEKNDAIIRTIHFIDDTSLIYCDKNVKIYKTTKI